MTIKKKREALTKLPPHLEGAFEEVLTRIDSKDEARKKLAYDAFKWVLYAVRPMTVVELLEALSVQVGSTSIDPDNRCNAKELFQCCAGLIVTENHTVRFAHYSVQQWLQSKLPETSNIFLASICLTYLCFDEFSRDVVKSGYPSLGPHSSGFIPDFLEERPLLDYAATNWTSHARNYEQSVHSLIMKLFQGKWKFETMRLVRYARNRAGEWSLKDYPRYSYPAHFLGREGLDVDPPEGWDLSSLDAYSRTPQHEACIGQQPDLVEKLLHLDPIINPGDIEGATALHLAGASGNLKIIDLLLGAKADLWQVDVYGYNPFQRAVFPAKKLSRRNC